MNLPALVFLVCGVAAIPALSAADAAPTAPAPAMAPAAAPAALLGEGPVARLPAAVRERAAALRDAAREGTGAWDLAASLTTEVGPRSAGSAGDGRAVEWALRTMRELGLENVRAEPVSVPHWVRGEARARLLGPYPQELVVTALGGSVGTGEEGVEGEVLEVADYDALLALEPAAVAGKVVFVNYRMQAARDFAGSGYGTAAKGRSRGPAAAFERGAVALVIRSAGTSNHRFAHTGSMRSTDGLAQLPAAALAGPDADLLERQLRLVDEGGGGEPVRLWLRLTSRMLSRAASANVVGEVRGRELPEEVVLLGAHLDSWDLGTGAEDDAAGCAIVLETARQLVAAAGTAAGKPRRTVRVVLFANEEFGLDGAKEYATAHAAAVEQHVAAVEADSGSGAPWRFSSRVGDAALPQVRGVLELLAPLGIAGASNDATGGADLSPLYKLGAPVFSIVQDVTRYFDVHHTADDTLDKIDRKGLDANVAAYLAFAWAAAEIEQPFARPPVPPPVTP